MVVKLNSLSRWFSLDSTRAILFSGADENERLVRVQFNLESVTTFYVGKDQQDADLLCTIGPGQETVEFYAAGDFYVFAEEGAAMVKYQSADLEPTFTEVVDPVIFTKIANRRHRNPELEEVMYRMQANMERRFAQLADEMQRNEVQNAGTGQTQVDAGTSSIASGVEVPAQVPLGQQSVQVPAGGVAVEQPGSTGGGDIGQATSSGSA